MSFFIIYMILSRFGEREPNRNTSILCTLLRGVRGGLKNVHTRTEPKPGIQEYERRVHNFKLYSKWEIWTPVANYQPKQFIHYLINKLIQIPCLQKKVLHSCPHSRIFPALSLKFANFSMLITRIHQFFRFIAYLPIFPGL